MKVCNVHHPLKEEGEVFLCNAWTEDFRLIGWRTKRLCERAYSVEGEFVRDLRSVFVQKEEAIRSRGTEFLERLESRCICEEKEEK